MFKTDGLTPLQLGRLNAVLDKLWNHNGTVKTMRQIIEGKPPEAEKQVCDGMIEWRRSHFNSLDHRGQDAYEARLKAKRLYFFGDTQVPKTVFDSIPGDVKCTLSN